MGREAPFSEGVARGLEDPKVRDRRLAKLQQFREVIAAAAQEYVDSSPFRSDVRDAEAAITRIASQFQRMAIRNPDIYGCTPVSIGQSIGFCVTTGLLPGGVKAQVDLITRKDKNQNNQLVLNPQVSWRGYLALAARAGRRVKANLVFAGETFEHEEGLDDRLVHLPDPDIDGYWTWEKLRAVYVVVRDAHNPLDKDFVVLYRKGLERRRNMAQSDAFWKPWPMEMSLKTGIRYAYDRGMLLLDEVGEWAMAQDRAVERDFIDAEPAPTRRKKTEPAPALTDHDPLGLGDDGFEGVDPHEDQPERVRVDEGVRDVVGGGRQETTPRQDAAPGPSSDDIEREAQTADDCDALREAVVKRYNGLENWKAPLRRDDAVNALKAELGRERLVPADRYDRAVALGVKRAWWSAAPNGALIPMQQRAGEVTGG